MEEALRFDFASVRSKPQRTPQGFLRLDANVTRTGVLLYPQPDGTIRRELRLPEEVFNSDSLATLANAPVTDKHPVEGMVTPENVRRLSRGVVSEKVRQDGNFVAADVIIQDSELIAGVESGDRREVSCGYKCRLDMTAGEYEGEKYDCIQRNIVYNHLGVGPKGWARAGSDVALRVDGGLVSYESKMGSHESADLFDSPPTDNVSPVKGFVTAKLKEMNKGLGHLAESLGVDVWAVRSFIRGDWDSIRNAKAWAAGAKVPPSTGLAKKADFEAIAKFIGVETKEIFDLVPETERGDGKQTPNQRNKTMDNVTINLDGVDYELPKAIAPHIDRMVKAKDAQISELTAKVDSVQASADTEKARADGLQTELDTVKAERDQLKDPAHLDGRVKERAALEGVAKKVLGDKATFDGKSDKDIKIECIAHADSTFKFDGQSDVYVDARFDGIKANVAAQTEEDRSRVNAPRLVLDSALNGKPTDELRTDSAKAEAAFKERSKKAWQQPLGASRQ